MSFYQQFKRSIKTEGSLVYNTAWVFSNKGLAILLSLAFTPILSRIYSPDDYGMFSIYSTAINNLIVLSSIGLSDSLLIVKKRNHFYSLFYAGIKVFMGVLFLSTFIVPLITTTIFGLSLTQSMSLLPLILFGITLTFLQIHLQRINAFSNNFSIGSKIGMTTSIVNRLVTLGLGFRINYIGFITGDLFSKLVSVHLHYRYYRDELKRHFSYSKKRYTKIAIKMYKRYPLFILPARYLSVLTDSLPIIYIGRLFGTGALGQFGIVISLIYLPLNLFANSIQSAFLRRIRDENNVGISRAIARIFWPLATIIFIPTIVLSQIIHIILPWALGKEWVLAGEIAKPMILITFPIIIDQVLQSVLQIQKREREILYYQLFHFATIFSAFAIPTFFSNQSIVPIVCLFVIARITVAAIRIDRVMIGSNPKIRIVNAVLSLILILNSLYFIK